MSLPTRLTDTTATLIDNIWTNNVEAKIGSGLVGVRISDQLPVFAFVGGAFPWVDDKRSRRDERKRLLDDVGLKGVGEGDRGAVL